MFLLTKMSNKISFQKLEIINVFGGDVYHALKKTDLNYENFGEAYFSIVHPSFIKVWKLHQRMTCNLFVPIGEIKFVITNNFIDFQTFIIGENNYGRLTIPPNFWFAFKCISKSKSIVLNISDVEHDPKEQKKKFIDEVDYDWS